MFVVTNMDRLARSTQHLLEIVEFLKGKGIALRILDFKRDRVDTHSPQGKLVLTIFAAFAFGAETLHASAAPATTEKARTKYSRFILTLSR
jgi:DNA invertase Pin-like site-specific DNA recombinase